MTDSSLDTFIAGVRSDWGPISTQLVSKCRNRLANLTHAPDTEEWLADLLAEGPAMRELHREPANAFLLLAHGEQAGLYRPPHDHGRGWVIYAVQHGEVAMGTYGRIETPDGQVRLVQRDCTVVRPGEVQVYLPGDIHDTRCLSDSALLFRFTDRDLRIEDRVEHRVTRYVERDGAWTTSAE